MSQRNNKKFIEERKKSSNLNIGCDIKEIIDKDENKLVLNGGFIYSYKKFNGFDKGYKAKGNFNSQGLREGKWVEQLKGATIECFYKDGIKKGKATIKNKNYELSGNFINNRIFKGKGIYTKNNKKYFIDDGIFEFQHFVYVYNDIELSSSFYVDSFPCIVREQNSNEKYILYYDDIFKKENVKLDTKEDKKKKTKTIEIEESIFGKVLYEFDSNGNLNCCRKGNLHEQDDLYEIVRYNKNGEITFKGYCDKDNKNVVGVEYEGGKVVFEGRYQNGKRYIGLGYDKSGKKNFYIASNNPKTDLQEKCLNNEGGDLNQKLYAKDFNKIENENQNTDKKDNYVFGVMCDNDKQYIGGFKYIDGEYVKDGECVEYSQEKNKIFFTTYKDGEKVKGKEYGGKGVLEFKGEYKYGVKWAGECKKYNKYNEFKGKYKDGDRYEKGKEYNKDGNLIFEGEFLNGVRNGKGKEYRTNGEVIFQGEYKDGKRWEGKVKEYYNDKLYFKGEYKDGKPYKGIQYADYFNNRFFEGEYKDGVPYRGKWYNSEDKLEFEGEKQYDNDSKTNSYKNGKRYIYYKCNNNDDCKINTEIEYKEYVMKKIKQYYKSGNIKREYNAVNDYLLFRSIFLDDINKEHFINNKGTFKEYYDNGKLKTFKYYYNNDYIPDYQISYYDNGNIQYECHKDESFGRYYSEDGKVIGVGKKDGEYNFFKYNEDGTISYKYRDNKQNISELTFKYNDEKYIDTIILKKYNKDNGELLKTYDVRKIFKKYIIDNSIIDEEFFINELQMNVRNYKPALDDFKRLPIPYRLAFVEELTNLFILKGGYDIGTPTSRFFSSIFNGESYRTFLKQQQFNENITNIAKRALNDEKKETKEEISEEQYIKNYKQNIKNVILKCFGLEHLIINPSQENINEFYKKKAKEEKIEDDYEEQEDTKIKESNLILSQNSVIDTNTKKPTPDTLKPTKNKEPAIKLTNRQIEDSLIEKGMPAPIDNLAPPIMQEEKIKEPIAVKLYNRKKNDEYFKQYNNDCKNVKISYTIEKQLDSAFKDAIDLNPGCCGCGSL